MKHISNFYSYIKEQDENSEKEDDKKKEDGVELVERDPKKLGQDFLSELEKHLTYWFSYGKIAEKYDMTSITKDEKAVVVWVNERPKEEGLNPPYTWKIKYTYPDLYQKQERIEEAILMITVYDFENLQKLKEKRLKIKLKHLDEDFLMKKLRKVRRRIVKEPEDQEDVDNFMKKQKRYFKDDIY